MPDRSAGTAVGHARLSMPGWLALREGADASARSPMLAERVRAYLAALARPGGPARPAGPSVVRDLGCGTGSMGRWLAGRLPGPQLWILHDRDPGLLAHAVAGMPRVAAADAAVTAQTQQGDLTDLRAAELAGTSLVTASAVLDLLTAEEVDGLATACVQAGCAALLTLSVIGRVELAPVDPLDAEFAAAFDTHQRRCTGGRRLLGPDAGPAAVDAFGRRGAAVASRPSPWRLGADQAELTEEWLRGWIGAACEQQPDLEQCAGAYLRRRLDACAAGELRVVVGHVDVLALPPSAS
ncbi:MAG: SAM-dependent methyltransferase [Pseudonocardiaceae bacterium]